MGLFGTEPVRPVRVGDPGYDGWWLYWFKQFNAELPKRHKDMDAEQLRMYVNSVEFWTEWRKYKQEKWYETGK